MSLGTNYKRNNDRNENIILKNINLAKELSLKLNCNLALASDVVLGRKTFDQALSEVSK